MKRLIIVAHPDDETIWMGGTILKYPNKEWTIVSLCRKEDSDRKPKFIKVCKYLNAEPIISNLDDEKLNPLPIEKIMKKIKSIVPEKEYDVIYTHGENGEYGHIRHKEIHEAIKRLIANKELKCGKFITFSYANSEKTAPNNSQLRIPIPNIDADEYVQLSRDNFKKKLFLIKNIYGFGGDSFEVLSCSNFEAFKIN